eukprot:TRINITY_DN35255_c0_g1_i1.p1 TRINITY_DN35255_c0_g1~~TRINITY_DN35255_c0_g1_i1.p1  ORF type:complete len:130 (-),score=17.32 TRINITY_DN35255_c0_g1_i1:79-468(-)
MSLTLSDECQAWKDTIKKEMLLQASKLTMRESNTTQRTRMSLTGSLLVDMPAAESAASSLKSWRPAHSRKGVASSRSASSRTTRGQPRLPRSPSAASLAPASRGGAPLPLRRSTSCTSMSRGIYGTWMP